MSAQTSQGVAARTVAMEAAPDRKKPGLLDRIADHFRRYWQLWILTAPALFFVGLFAYVPMWGIQLAFREFDPTKGLTGGKFVGFKYFNEFFHNPLFGEIMTNTIRISLWTLVMGFIFPIILALLINQIGSKKIKGFVQTVTYMPHFISVVVIVSMLNIFLSPGSGILGRFFGDESLMGSTSAITAVYWISEVWQHVGWNSIIFPGRARRCGHLSVRGREDRWRRPSATDPLRRPAGDHADLRDPAHHEHGFRAQRGFRQDLPDAEFAEYAGHRGHRDLHLQDRYY